MYQRVNTSEVQKSGGEGSRGGHVIGHTKSGKPIYGDKRAGHSDYKDFSLDDHAEASSDHRRLAYQAGQKGDKTAHEIHSRISTSHDEAWHNLKFPDNPIQKSATGEGSRGGHVIGHTRSGKAIYDTPSHLAHAGFTYDEHEEAADLHDQHVDRHEANYDRLHRQNKFSDADHAASQADIHRNRSIRHRELANRTTMEKSGGEGSRGGNVIAKSGYSAIEFRKGEGGVVVEKAGGEGSRGGHVIGHTGSGKPIYEGSHPVYSAPYAKHEDKYWGGHSHVGPTAQGGGAQENLHRGKTIHKRLEAAGHNYSEQDHHDAAAHHEAEATSVLAATEDKYTRNNPRYSNKTPREWWHHKNMAELHRGAAAYVNRYGKK